MKRKIFVALFCIAAVGFSSCSDYLSVERFFNDRLNEEKIFKDKQYTEEFLAYCYNRLIDTNLEIATLYFTVSNYADDIIFNEEDGPINYRTFKLGQYDYSWTNASYIRCYEGIRQTTIFLNAEHNCPDFTAEETADLIAQARFLRGYFYWLLMRKYGPVPILYDQVIPIDESYIGMSVARSSYDEVANYIANEMELAAKDLPEYRDNMNIARATRGAALTLRAKVLLYAASPINNPGGPSDGDPSETFLDFVDNNGRKLMAQEYDGSKWARAAAAAKDVIDLNVYKLYTAAYNSKGSDAYPATVNPPHHDIYSEKDFPEGWANIDPFESYRAIFNGDLYVSENPELIFTRGTNGIEVGVRSIVRLQMPKAVGGENCHGLTAKQCDAYDMNNGLPFDINTCEKGFVTEEELDKYPQLKPGVWKEYANREPRFYASVAFNGAFWPCTSSTEDDYRNKQAWYYRGSAEGRTNSTHQWIPTGIGMMKFVSPKDCLKGNGHIYDKVDIAFRYADVLRMYAEALNELGNSSYEVSSWDGKSYTISRVPKEMSKAVSQVRIRAGVPDYDEATYQDQSAFRKKLKHERQVELMGENQRYYDLRRWKDAPKEESTPIYGCNVLMTEDHAERYYERVRVEDLQATFSRKMYFWPVNYDELKNNRYMTQAPGWLMYD